MTIDERGLSAMAGAAVAVALLAINVPASAAKARAPKAVLKKCGDGICLDSNATSRSTSTTATPATPRSETRFIGTASTMYLRFRRSSNGLLGGARLIGMFR
jgi:hypothetical protein